MTKDTSRSARAAAYKKTLTKLIAEVEALSKQITNDIAKFGFGGAPDEAGICARLCEAREYLKAARDDSVKKMED